MAQSQDEFKSSLFEKLKKINQKLNNNETLSDEDKSVLLMSSILEEQG